MVLLGMFTERFTELYRDSRPLLFNHDEVQIIVPNELEDLKAKASKVATEVQSNMPIDFITGLDIQIGDSWASSH